MPELRKDPILGRWVIIAPERLTRPQALQAALEEPSAAFDPFLEGNEDATAPEIFAYREPGAAANGPGWRVRVVPNKFPALRVEENLQMRGEGIYDRISGVGAHEVVIECPHFETSMANLSVDAIREVLWVYRHRLVDLKRDTRLVQALIFKNKGAAAGASLAHSHSQLIVTPIVPIAIREELAGAQEFHRYRGRNIFSDMIQQELADESRVVIDSPGYLVHCPYASRFPFETWIIPKQHASHFEEARRQEIDELGTVLRQTLRKLDVALDDPAYNYVLHTAPFDVPDLPYYTWHIEIYPRITGTAGFEWGSGFHINSVAPEVAAEALRNARPERDA
ncbi:MAG: galactose-1-phosphate uridylyltransferase [Planctomycetota bacterium]|nr:MAG: galactose-1-phosphate uridylyltransferase [Planctomycetota bacterium]REJ88050.1 MAG: galactose-1-phosphate uridylyltransferase [Planctomycetota bacterium]REK24203.1 MAG: galactose-1-phosphate uridylyltransferase [Planctomycetota bacterium]REK28809.1 MAG: galactose-1-phosphate uridylyltransferase [Planctomycetota bacterium]